MKIVFYDFDRFKFQGNVATKLGFPKQNIELHWNGGSMKKKIGACEMQSLKNQLQTLKYQNFIRIIS